MNVQRMPPILEWIYMIQVMRLIAQNTIPIPNLAMAVTRTGMSA